MTDDDLIEAVSAALYAELKRQRLEREKVDAPYVGGAGRGMVTLDGSFDLRGLARAAIAIIHEAKP